MERPSLYPDLAVAYESFFALSLGRQYNEAGPQPISFSDMLLCVREEGYDTQDEKDELLTYIRALDSKYLELSHDKIRKTREKLNKKNNSSNKGGSSRR